MKKLIRKQTLAAVIVLTMILGFTFFTQTKDVQAAEPEIVKFNVDTSLTENLVMLKGKSVTVFLASGQTITGVVTSVKGNLLHLGKLSQKEFYDALVSIDHISAIEARVK
ncbi:MAG: hypothetical protein HQK60_15615 [Deltaproteobacteria bacterium]|nr:hypothetical protein [Deltaproteobacteria bacterium]